MKKVAINGLGRIGRVLHHYMEVQPKEVEFVAVTRAACSKLSSDCRCKQVLWFRRTGMSIHCWSRA